MEQEELPDYFWAERLTPINFYGYTSSTKERIYHLDTHQEHIKIEKSNEIQRFHDLKTKCLAMFVDMRRKVEDEPVWVKDIWDNKIVIECKTESGDIIFVGFYDSMYNIGKSVYSRDRIIPRPYKQVNHASELSV